MVGLTVAGRGRQPGGFQNGAELIFFNGPGFVILAAGLPLPGNF
jgi:hypothetical protein